jgi:hypothetical protein
MQSTIYYARQHWWSAIWRWWEKLQKEECALDTLLLQAAPAVLYTACLEHAVTLQLLTQQYQHQQLQHQHQHLQSAFLLHNATQVKQQMQQQQRWLADLSKLPTLHPNLLKQQIHLGAQNCMQADLLDMQQHPTSWQACCRHRTACSQKPSVFWGMQSKGAALSCTGGTSPSWT